MRSIISSTAARLLAGAIITAAIASTAEATTIADFELNGSLANSVSNGITLTNNGGVLGAQGISFGLNAGPTVYGISALSAYTIDVGFTISKLNGPSGTGYVKLIDFSSLVSDNGYYSYFGFLNSYPLSSSANQVFTADTPIRLTLSRDSAGLITAYIDGTQIYTQSDPTNASATKINGKDPLTFFVDDIFTVKDEASPGFVDYIRIADVAVTPAMITPVTPPAPVGVPEPATWSMMITGIVAARILMRRRSGITMQLSCAG